MKSQICPICNGTGKLPCSYYNKKSKIPDKKIMAQLLDKDGYSVREIMRFLNYESPRSIQILLLNKNSCTDCDIKIQEGHTLCEICYCKKHNIIKI